LSIVAPLNQRNPDPSLSSQPSRTTTKGKATPNSSRENKCDTNIVSALGAPLFQRLLLTADLSDHTQPHASYLRRLIRICPAVRKNNLLSSISSVRSIAHSALFLQDSKMLTAKTKILIGAFTKNPPAGTPVSPPTFVPFNVYIFPDPAEKSGAYQLALRSRDLTAFLELPGPFNVVSESSIPQTYVNSHSHHFRTAPPTSDDYIDDYYSFSALRACAISLGRHDLEELCKLKLDDVLAGRYLTPISKNRMVRAEMVPLQTPFHFHVVNINTPVSASLSPRSDNAFSPTYSRGPYVPLPVVLLLSHEM